MPFVPLTLVDSTANSFTQRQAYRRPHMISSRTLRRRPNPEQGRALEILGHAIEYLMDSELHATDKAFSPDITEAAQTLMHQSRRVFADCDEVVPFRESLREGLIRMFGRPVLMLPPARIGHLQADTLTR